jgi:CheY-like chemotaxis protein
VERLVDDRNNNMNIVLGFNGYQLCLWLRKQPKFQNIPIIIISNKDSEFEQNWAIKKGANAYLTKVEINNKLTEVIEKMLCQSVYVYQY